MGKPKINLGDKVFLYGLLLENIDFEDVQYNCVEGYMTVGGYLPSIKETSEPFACIPGFVSQIPYSPELAVAAPFNQLEMVDVTEKLSLSPPLLAGCKVWLPTTTLLQEHSPLLQN